MNRQHLLSRLAAMGWNVAYSTGALRVYDLWSDGWANAPWFGRLQPSGGVLVDRVGKLPIRWPRFAHLDAFAMRSHAQRILGDSRLRWSSKGILLLFHPQYWPYVDALKPRKVAFHIYDDYMQMGGASTDVSEMMHKLCRRADLVTACTSSMAEPVPDDVRQRVRILPNGADFQMFATKVNASCPVELAAIPEPRIGYFGAINRRTDFNAVVAVARTHPSWNWVFVGNVNEGNIKSDPEAANGYEEARSCPNVRFLGARDYASIPAYMANVTVNTICYRIREGEWVRSGYPVKLNEYLAIGRPVVASAQDVVSAEFSAVVRVVRSTDEWNDALEEAIEGRGAGTFEQRQAIARANDWNERAVLFDRWLKEIV